MPLSYDQREYLRQQGANINQHGTIYRSGASLPYTKKLEVASAYSTERDAAGGKRPNISTIAQQCGVSRGYVRKVEEELHEFGRTLQHDERRKHNSLSNTGLCSESFSNEDITHEEKNGADKFALQLEMAIASGFFCPGDVHVLDNASIHYGGDNSNLEEWLYDTVGVLLVFLPARSPELNPIEQVWKILVNKLQRVPLGVMRSAGSHACAHAAIEILSTITHEEVEGCYRYCNYL